MPENLPQEGTAERLWDHEKRIRRVEDYTRSHEPEIVEKWLHQHQFNSRIEETVDGMEEREQRSREDFLVQMARAKMLVALAILLGNGIAIAILGVMIQKIGN